MPRRELGVLLAAALLRGAGLDWFEQGDVWGLRGPAPHPINRRFAATLPEPACKNALC